MITTVSMPGRARREPSDEHAQSAETIPAPSGTVRSDEVLPRIAGSTASDNDVLDAPSARPTALPDYDVEALAAASTWDVQVIPSSQGSTLSIDLSVPVRKRVSSDGAPLRAAFLLSHVDDRSTIAEIATTSQIALDEAIEHFVFLADLGVVELRGAARKPSASPVVAHESAVATADSAPEPKT